MPLDSSSSRRGVIPPLDHLGSCIHVIRRLGTLAHPDPVLAGRLAVRAVAGVVRTTLARETQLVAEDRFVDELIALALGFLRR